MPVVFQLFGVGSLILRFRLNPIMTCTFYASCV